MKPEIMSSQMKAFELYFRSLLSGVCYAVQGGSNWIFEVFEWNIFIRLRGDNLNYQIFAKEGF